MSLHYAREDEVSYIGKDLFFMNSQRLELFVDWLMNDINVSVRNILEAKKEQGYYICLSTAAPENYVRIISERLGFDGFVHLLFLWIRKGTGMRM